MVVKPLLEDASQACAACLQDGKGCGEARCAIMTSESQRKVVELVPNLTDAELVNVMQPYADVRVWRLDFHGLQSPWDAFGGFQCSGKDTNAFWVHSCVQNKT